MAGWGQAAAGAHSVDALAPCSVLDDGLDDGAGQGGLVDPHAGLAGGALDTIDQGAPPRRAALALATLDRLLVGSLAAVVDGLAIDKLADPDAAAAADFTAERGDDAG